MGSIPRLPLEVSSGVVAAVALVFVRICDVPAPTVANSRAGIVVSVFITEAETGSPMPAAAALF